MNAEVQPQPIPPEPAPPNAEWDEDEDYDDEDDSDSDIDAEAQEIARRLGEQLWADLNGGEPAPPTTNEQPASIQAVVLAAAVPTPYRKAEEAALNTIKAVLHLIENDPLAKSLLSSTPIPGLGGNVLDALSQSVVSGTIPKSSVTALSHVLVSLASSEQLFGGLRNSDTAAVQLQQGKRKFDQMDDQMQQHDGGRIAKRPFAPEQDLQTQVTDAVRTILQAFASAPTPLDPALISSIRLPLHQVFLFAVTSSARGGPEMHALQEISGLIQVVGVLSGIQIGHGPEMTPANQYPPGSYPWIPGHGTPPATDIGSAVYPCLIPGCKKVFSRLYNLRAHQRNHAVHRPFRCTTCPASFARNHDLKRHIKLHDRKAWKCGSCQKMFSRRDAFKRHTNSSKTRGPRGDLCTDADVIEVELDDDGSSESQREERRVKLWSGIAQTGTIQGVYREHAAMEEGEVHETIIQAIQASVLTLHPVLQGLVGNVLGIPAQPGQPDPPMADAAGSQATLASVIARAQSQNLPSALPPDASLLHPTHAPANAEPLLPQEDVEMNVVSPDGGHEAPPPQPPGPSLAPLTMYGLSDEQTKMLELAIANAALAAQAQAEAEAALEEEDEEDDDDDEDEEDDEEDRDQPEAPPTAEVIT